MYINVTLFFLRVASSPIFPLSWVESRVFWLLSSSFSCSKRFSLNYKACIKSMLLQMLKTWDKVQCWKVLPNFSHLVSISRSTLNRLYLGRSYSGEEHFKEISFDIKHDSGVGLLKMTLSIWNRFNNLVALVQRGINKQFIFASWSLNFLQ